MPSDKKKVTIQYRRLDDVTGGFQSITLQEALSRAMNCSLRAVELEIIQKEEFSIKTKSTGTF